ncbi:sigma 54-interacting transcriptional regulator [Flavobacterium sp. LC2016-01]|uniref:sigma 54-interacting transcriptional regulator n=1 Tax=Flavobacterium sp. LC2016-01 TaxID=2675876 RepID=UPI0012BAE917|nr:sigma 54-interacting transcriptional regulator [Flavobacterium sp. LC2016-01]MTH15843.1 AAA domain-containing protein [Flavobacterium sp. LC2016-01]
MDSKKKPDPKTNTQSGVELLAKDKGNTKDELSFGSDREVLLSIAKKLVYVRSRESLEEFVGQNLKDLFGFSDMVFMLVFKQKARLMAVIKYFEQERVIRPEYLYLLKGGTCSSDDGIADATLKAGHPLVFTMDEVLQWEAENIPPYVTVFSENKMKKLLTIPIAVDDQVSGVIYFYSKDSEAFPQNRHELLFSIGQQLSAVMLNILAREEIQKRDFEKEFLLKLGNSLSGVRTKNDLAETLDEHFHNLPFFSEALILWTDKEEQMFIPATHDKSTGVFLSSVSGQDASEKNYAFLNQLFPAGSPIEFSIKNALLKKDIPECVFRWAENGIKKVAAAKIFHVTEPAGILFLFSKETDFYFEHYFDLIASMAYQLSAAAANLHAAEQMQNREKEKSILLELNSAMASIRNKNDLQKVINEKLKKLLPVGDLVACVKDDQTGEYSPYLRDPDSVCSQEMNYTDIALGCYIDKEFERQVLRSSVPLVYDLEELSDQKAEASYLKKYYKLGMREAVYVALGTGAVKTGILILILNSRKSLTQNFINLISGIAAQLSIAIANIIANEKIERQIEEITRYKQQLEEENLYLQEEILTTHNYSEIIGDSHAMHEVFRLVSQVSESESTVLILGETGTGKELIARALHNTSKRKDKVMVKVNCATLPSNLIESELFGHEKGSFTGATDRRIGKFELANNSTLFLDEVGELPLDLQVKLLRAIQEKEIERVGGRTVIKTDVRIIAATNRDLKKEVAAGNFRSDLYFRLDVFPIVLPPLRERIDDIPFLVPHFLQKHSKNTKKEIMKISSMALKQLMAYQWPGNVRELEHMIERSILLSNGNCITHVNLPGISDQPEGGEEGPLRIKTIEENERDHIVKVLKSCKGKIGGIGGAAQILDLPISTLNSRIKKLGIKKHYLKD